MIVANSYEMKQIDKRAIEKYNIPGIILMENAAHAVLDEIIKLNFKKILIVCGSGNNGGDGFALARLLHMNSYDVDIFYFFEESKLKGDAKINYDILKSMNFNMINNLDELREGINNYDVVVDALFGTGLNGDIKDEIKLLIDVINKGKFILSIDVPSGVNSDTGQAFGKCVYANMTVTFECKKYGHLLGEGRVASGDVVVKKISIPQSCIEEQEIKTFTCDDFYPMNIYQKRLLDSNKGDYGKIYIIGGSYTMSGAVILALKAAMRSGAGLVYGIYPKSIIDRVATQIPEIVNIPCDEKDGLVDIDKDLLNQVINRAKVISVGVGLGRSNDIKEMIKFILKNFTGNVVIDADGLNNICDDLQYLKEAKCKIIITPHPGEMSRLTGLSIDYINNNRVTVAKDFAKEYNCVVLLKGSSTIVTDGEKIYINTTGNPGMATAGAGDVLTGIITSLLGQGYNLFDSGVLGCYLHGKVGDEAYKSLGYGLTASDIAENVGKFLKF